jgi:hypothetical protein
MSDLTKAIHVIEAFTLHEIEKIEGRARPTIKQTAFDRGELVTDPANIALVEKARDEGTISGNHFVTVMMTPIKEEKAEEKLAAEDEAKHLDPINPETWKPEPGPMLPFDPVLTETGPQDPSVSQQDTFTKPVE